MRADHDSEMTCERPSLIILINIIVCVVVLRDDLTSRENELEEMKKREKSKKALIKKLKSVGMSLKKGKEQDGMMFAKVKEQDGIMLSLQM